MKNESIARTVVVLLIIIAVGIPFVGRWKTNRSQQNTIEIHARTFENGSWSVDTIQVKVGEPVNIRLTSDDVVHGFAVGGYSMNPLELIPGENVEATLIFDKPGMYTFFCNRWCSPDHTRMRGVVEVLPED